MFVVATVQALVVDREVQLFSALNSIHIVDDRLYCLAWAWDLQRHLVNVYETNVLYCIHSGWLLGLYHVIFLLSSNPYWVLPEQVVSLNLITGLISHDLDDCRGLEISKLCQLQHNIETLNNPAYSQLHEHNIAYWNFYHSVSSAHQLSVVVFVFKQSAKVSGWSGISGGGRCCVEKVSPGLWRKLMTHYNMQISVMTFEFDEYQVHLLMIQWIGRHRVVCSCLLLVCNNEALVMCGF